MNNKVKTNLKLEVKINVCVIQSITTDIQALKTYL
jgi:hypothetical protein